MTARHRRWVGAVALPAASSLVLLTGCGVPTGDPAEPIPASDVPFGLATPTTEPAPSTSPTPAPGVPEVYLLAAGDHLVPRGREVLAGALPDRLESVLDELAAGPTSTERDAQLSTALPPEVELDVVEVSGGTATIDLSGSEQVPSGTAGRRAVAQVVLTATSVAGISSVVLTVDGERVEAPLPSGELTADPLTAVDYTEFLTPVEQTPVAEIPAPASPAPSVPAPPS
ncbi:GerMN domain-containing protein [Geodermatophilus marinus]|uniref:GerMN domain-containing protein n=1 Tax=Geodermatophilus sp. LHW52908 TaxID=2303986 RepID=UPI00131483B0|nr:GerMN domain-containing protein [Geodermatophilus sp. LHW52908]